MRKSILVGAVCVLGHTLFAQAYQAPGSLFLSKSTPFNSPSQISQNGRAPELSLRKSSRKLSSLQMQQRGPGEDFMANSMAQSAAIAAAAVNAAVSMRPLEAPDVDKTYIVKDAARQGIVDDEGLPIVYDKDLIEAYWKSQDGALQKRWREFLGVTVPFLTKLVTLLVRGGMDEVQKNEAMLAREARINMEKLGPTYIKAGQMMSVRPDVLPQAALDELAVLQDSVKPFDTKVAIDLIESELGGELGQFFTEISEEPVAAASLAQVYKATLITGETVAVKVQRPDVLSLVSKDLYVLRRAAEVYQGLVDRFAPQQRTNYVALLNEWAVGFYTELDFQNEGTNQRTLKNLLAEQNNTGVYIPEVYEEFSTRRILVTEWIDGIKLSECEPHEIKEYIKVGQECFLTQLLQVGFFHSDPHPGNIIRMNDNTKGEIALIDFGLVARLQQTDMDQIVNAIIHLANKDYASLVDDFVQLNILPPDCDRQKVIPLMDKALSPYVKGGGAKKYEEELKRLYGMDGSTQGSVGGFQAMTQDALTVLNDIPFSIPPYFALIARAVVTLEGVALIGDPDYGLVMEAYPFVARKLLREDRPEVQSALQQVLYANGGFEAGRLSVLLNGAMDVVARNNGGAFIDFDSIPEEGVPLKDAVQYLLSDKAISLRRILEDELETAADVLIRQALRKAFTFFTSSLPRPPLFGQFLPAPETVPTPFLLPTASGTPAPALVTPQELIEAVAPKLTRVKLPPTTPLPPAPRLRNPGCNCTAAPPAVLQRDMVRGHVRSTDSGMAVQEEELYALSLADLIEGSLGYDVATLIRGDALLEPRAIARVMTQVLATGQAPGWEALPAQAQPLVQQALAALGGRGPAPKAGSQESGQQEEVLEVLAELNEQERAVVTREGQEVAQRLWNQILARLAPIAGVEPPMVNEKGGWLTEEYATEHTTKGVPKVAPEDLSPGMPLRSEEANVKVNEPEKVMV